MSTEPLVEYVSSLAHHERELLLGVLEVAERAVIMDCREKEIYRGLRLALWKTVKIEEME